MTFALTYGLAWETLTGTYELGVDQAQQMAESMARRVADANQGADCKLCFDFSALPTGRIHWLTQEQAREKLEGTVSGLIGDPEDFGRALHGIQDSYAHRGQGYTYSPVVFGMLEHKMGTVFNGGSPDFFENASQWGHAGISSDARDFDLLGFPIKATLPYSLDPDYYDHNSPRDQAMWQETIYWIRVYLQHYYKWLLENDVTWEDLEWESDETQ